MKAICPIKPWCLVWIVIALAGTGNADGAKTAWESVRDAGIRNGICVVLGLPQADRPEALVELAKGSELLVYFQSDDARETAAVLQAAEEAGLLGNRIFAQCGDGSRVFLADNLASAVVVCPSTEGNVSRDEIIRVLHPLYLADDELRFTTGGQYGCARFDLRTGRCLNEPIDSFPARHAYRTVFYSYYPKWGAYVFLQHRLDDDTTLFYNRTMDSDGFFLHYGTPEALSRWKSFTMQPRKVTGELLWERQDLSRLRGIILAGDRLLVAGDGQTGPFAAALRTKDGESIWQVALNAPTVKHGLAIGRDGRAFISLEDGQVACLAP